MIPPDEVAKKLNDYKLVISGGPSDGGVWITLSDRRARVGHASAATVAEATALALADYERRTTKD